MGLYKIKIKEIDKKSKEENIKIEKCTIKLKVFIHK